MWEGVGVRRFLFFAVALMVSAALGMGGAMAADNSGQNVFFAAPNGGGGACTQALPCTLSGARDKVRSVNSGMDQDIIVNLRGGSYELEEPLELAGRDSGSGGRDVIYRAYSSEKPVLSGGARVAGWAMHDASKGIYVAEVPASLNTRQLYVNGSRAVRARSERDPAGFTPTEDGYTTDGTEAQNWDGEPELGNPVEFVDLEQWRDIRCGVESVSGADIAMLQPCWKNAQLSSEWGNYMPKLNEPTWIENSYQFLDEPGEWYLDRSESRLYYKPRAGEDISASQIIAPRTEKLIEARGTLDNPVRDIRFSGITFANTTWLRPSTNEGYAPEVAGFLHDGDPVYTYKTPASIDLDAAKNIRFEGNLFENLGSNAINLDNGSQGNAVIGNTFEDISSGGVYIGDVQDEDHHPTDERSIVKDNVVENNYITRVGADYFDGVGVLATFTEGTVISHNEIHDVPFNGISLGYGWGRVDPGGEWGYSEPTPAKDNEVTHNLIYDYLEVLRDGGGIYTTGSLPGTTVSHNYIYDQGRDQASLYPDEATKYVTFSNNVSSRVLSWLHMWSPTASGNSIQNNFSSSPLMEKDGDNEVAGNTFVGDGDWPQAALDIMSGAGPGYRNIEGQSAAGANTRPDITIASPNGTMPGPRPIMKSVVRDRESALTGANISVTVDGKRITEFTEERVKRKVKGKRRGGKAKFRFVVVKSRNFSYDQSTGTLSFVPKWSLSPGGHRMTVTARDPQGLASSESRDFYVASAPEDSGLEVDALGADMKDYAEGSQEAAIRATLSADSFTSADFVCIGFRDKQTGQYSSSYLVSEPHIDRGGTTVEFEKILTRPGTYEYWVSYRTDGEDRRIGPTKELTVST